jgi:hypothetical protein
MPSALNTPQNLLMNIFYMPRSYAISQQCCAPAPPNTDRMCLAGSRPFRWVIALTAFAMFSLAIRTNPIASYYTVNPFLPTCTAIS